MHGVIYEQNKVPVMSQIKKKKEEIHTHTYKPEIYRIFPSYS